MARGEIVLITSVDDYLGPACAAACAEQGYTVVGHSLAFESDLARTEFEQGNSAFHALRTTNTLAAVCETIEKYGRIDAAVSNELPFRLVEGKIERIEPDDLASMCDVLLDRPAAFLDAVIASMVTRGGGRIVIVTSGAATRFPHIPPAGPGYAAVRAGANRLAQLLAVELAPDNIQINAIAPFFLYLGWRFEEGPEHSAYRDMVREKVPIGRFGMPEEAGALAAFLLSGESMFTTGQIVAFSGAGA